MATPADPALGGGPRGVPGTVPRGIADAVGVRSLRVLRAVGRLMLAVPRPAAACVALAWMGLNSWLSSVRIDPPGEGLGGSYVSNLAHGPLYGLLALWWIAALPRRAAPSAWARLERRDLATVLALVVGWGIADEWLQSTRPFREGSAFDLATDAVAALAVLLAARAAGEPDAAPRRIARIVVAGLAAVALAALVATAAAARAA